MDYSSIIVGALAFVGTLAGCYFSNNKTQALIAYRLQQLEEKVNKHNNVVERMYDPDYTKLTPAERASLEEALADSETIPHDAINWD